MFLIHFLNRLHFIIRVSTLLLIGYVGYNLYQTSSLHSMTDIIIFGIKVIVSCLPILWISGKINNFISIKIINLIKANTRQNDSTKPPRHTKNTHIDIQEKFLAAAHPHIKLAMLAHVFSDDKRFKYQREAAYMNLLLAFDDIEEADEWFNKNVLLQHELWQSSIAKNKLNTDQEANLAYETYEDLIMG